MPQRFFKQSPALEDYDFDWSGWLVDGDFITGFTVTADDGVTLGDVLHQQGSPIIKQFVGGGTHGNSYKVTCAIRTDQGRADVAQVIILIRDIGTGGQPIPPPLEEDEMTIFTDLTLLVSFPQAGVAFHPGTVTPNSITAIKTGRLITLSWSMAMDLKTGPLDHLEMVLPTEFWSIDQTGFSAASIYSYLAPPPGPPVQGINRLCGAYFDRTTTGHDRLALYAEVNPGTFPVGDWYYFAGQMTYMAAA